VITWDPYPKADVSRWDGLQDIDGDVNKMPFYHVAPDLEDTVKAFGQERPFRYVCQENLELCPESEQDIEVTLDEEWSSSSGEDDFKPSDSLKFRHAEELGDDDNAIIACLDELQVSLRLRIRFHFVINPDVIQLFIRFRVLRQSSMNYLLAYETDPMTTLTSIQI